MHNYSTSGVRYLESGTVAIYIYSCIKKHVCCNLGYRLFRAKRGLYSDSIDVCMASLRVSKTSFLVGTRTLALSTGASVSDIRGLLQIYSLAGLDSPCWSMFAWLENVALLCYHQRGSLESMSPAYPTVSPYFLGDSWHTGYILPWSLFNPTYQVGLICMIKNERTFFLAHGCRSYHW